MIYIIGQIIGVIGFIVSIVSFLQQDDKKMKSYLGLSSVLVATSYYLIGAFAGAASMMISALRNYAACYGAKNKIIYVIFLLITLGSGFYTYQKPLDMMPIVGAMIATTALFMFAGMMMRFLMIIACLLWLIYDINAQAVGPALMEIFNICACLLAMRKLKQS